MNENFKLITNNDEVFDKKKIAVAIRKSNLSGAMGCSILEEGIMKDCGTCCLKDVCEDIDEIIMKDEERCNKVIKSFTF